MMSTATSVAGYLAALPEERRVALQAVREAINANLDADHEEGLQYGMIAWYVPLRVYPRGYAPNPRQGVPLAALASQKAHMALYLMGLYCGAGVGGLTDEARWFQEAWKEGGRRLDMGRSCVRFRRLEDVPLDVVGEAIRRLPAREYLRRYEAGLA